MSGKARPGAGPVMSIINVDLTVDLSTSGMFAWESMRIKCRNGSFMTTSITSGSGPQLWLRQHGRGGGGGRRVVPVQAQVGHEGSPQ